MKKNISIFIISFTLIACGTYSQRLYSNLTADELTRDRGNISINVQDLQEIENHQIEGIEDLLTAEKIYNYVTNNSQTISTLKKRQRKEFKTKVQDLLSKTFKETTKTENGSTTSLREDTKELKASEGQASNSSSFSPSLAPSGQDSNASKPSYKEILDVVINTSLSARATLRQYNLDKNPLGEGMRLYSCPVSITFNSGRITSKNHRAKAKITFLPQGCNKKFKIVAISPQSNLNILSSLNESLKQLAFNVAGEATFSTVSFATQFESITETLQKLEESQTIPEMSASIIDNTTIEVDYLGKKGLNDEVLLTSGKQFNFQVFIVADKQKDLKTKTDHLNNSNVGVKTLVIPSQTPISLVQREWKFYPTADYRLESNISPQLSVLEPNSLKIHAYSLIQNPTKVEVNDVIYSGKSFVLFGDNFDLPNQLKDEKNNPKLVFDVYIDQGTAIRSEFKAKHLNNKNKGVINSSNFTAPNKSLIIETILEYDHEGQKESIALDIFTKDYSNTQKKPTVDAGISQIKVVDTLFKEKDQNFELTYLFKGNVIPDFSKLKYMIDFEENTEIRSVRSIPKTDLDKSKYQEITVELKINGAEKSEDFIKRKAHFLRILDSNDKLITNATFTLTNN